MKIENIIQFAPQLFIKSGITDVSFYEKAFDAVELRRFANEDGSIHVVEFSIHGTIFHLREEKQSAGTLAPHTLKATTTTIGLFVPDVDYFMKKAKAAGGIEISPAQDYDYGYRQGEIKDPFGHHWLIEMKI